MRKASGGKRIVAYIIDLIIISLVSLAITKIISGIFGDGIIDNSTIHIGEFYSFSYITLILNLIIFIIYYCVIPLFWEKQTVGRFLLNIKVVKDSTNKMKFTDFLLRDFLGFYIIVSVLISLCFLGLIINAVLLFGKEQTTIQDKIAQTIMIDMEEKNEELNKDDDGYYY